MNFSVKASPYTFKVHFVISKDKKEIKAFVQKHLYELSDEDLDKQDAITFYEDARSPVVCLKSPPKSPKEYGEFYHEVHHACTLIAGNVGMTSEEIAGETFAYFIESIVVKALTKINKLCLTSTSAAPASSSSKNSL